MGRSMTPGQMEAALPPVFERLGRLGAKLFHYKMCSTFDSSPEVGSIGRAIDIGQRIFASPFVPLVVGAPVLRRYCLFGNLFATVGDETFRLDRHPTMRCHPVTPMDEADLRVHLARQTSKTTALMDILHLTGAPAEVDRRFEHAAGEPAGPRPLRRAGRAATRGGGPADLDACRRRWAAVRRRIVGVGVRADGPLASLVRADRAPAVPVAGAGRAPSRSSRAVARPRRGIRSAGRESTASPSSRSLPAAWSDPERADGERGKVVRGAIAALERGRSVVICTAVAPDDPRIAETLDLGNERGLPPHATRERIGDQLGRVLRELLDATSIRRVVVAGGIPRAMSSDRSGSRSSRSCCR